MADGPELLEPPLENRRRYINAFKKVVGSFDSIKLFIRLKTTETGTPYPCSKRDIESATSADYHHVKEKPALGNFLSKEEATVQLERSLLPTAKLTPSTEEALKRLRNMLLLDDKDWGPDLVIKSFNDWDKVFFNRRLKGHVRVCWKSEAFDTSMRKDLYGVEFADGVSWRWAHVNIHINADRALLFPASRGMRAGEAPVSAFRSMWGTFLHECCHAYLGILTGDPVDQDEEAEGYDGSHGRHFQRCIYAVDRSARGLLGLAAMCDYGTRGNLPQKLYDVKNHQVIPRDPKIPILKRLGVRQIIKTCSQMVTVLRRV